ncbi:hypothetical protein [Saccharothrix algeriensis]|uniref:Secreted protein n=2 Tax=Saccharothrix algeriensis TaxID=173560 RepID=A0ABS2S7P9_9PSEU|nr:hypothetical protein [Saccharothrix algeriensis]MBM7812248.1 hypothetical protein [Saccharothrix algeriensis]
MRTRLTRPVAAAAVALAVGAAGSGTADAAEPVVVGECATTVRGAPGTPVALSPAAVVQPVTDLVRAVPLLGPPLAEPFRRAFTALPPIPVGSIPTGSGVITGGRIADAVVAELDGIALLGPVAATLAHDVRTTLSALCGVAVTGVNTAAAPVRDGSKAIADAAEQATGRVPGLPGDEPAPDPGAPPTDRPGGGQPGGTPGTGDPGAGTPGADRPGGGLAGGSAPVGGVGGTDLPPHGSNPFGRVPLFGHGALPSAALGRLSPPGARHGGDVPGYGLLGADGTQTAGRATALPGAGGGVAAPVLPAVLALSCVAGALARTWARRRAAG